MGEPSLTRIQILCLPPTDVEQMVKNKFPGCTIREGDTGGWYITTIHGVGDTREQAMENALIDLHDMKRDAEGLDQMLTDVDIDLRERGYSRDRHDWAIDILNLCDKALGDGVIVGVINPLMVPSYTRKITEYTRRADTRLRMLALNMQEEEAARKRAGTKFPRVADSGASPYAQLKARQKP